jgi:DNA-binding MarR family transcriptional regulator
VRVTPQTTLSTSEDEVVGALLAFSRVLIGVAARSLAELDEDVTLAQFRTLVVLGSRGPQRIVDLAQELSVTSSTATRMCNRLMRKGFLAREERAEDRRAVWITLTAPGRDLVLAVMERRRKAIAALVGEISLARPLAFVGVVNALVEAADEPTDAEWRRRWTPSDT